MSAFALLQEAVYTSVLYADPPLHTGSSIDLSPLDSGQKVLAATVSADGETYLFKISNFTDDGKQYQDIGTYRYDKSTIGWAHPAVGDHWDHHNTHNGPVVFQQYLVWQSPSPGQDGTHPGYLVKVMGRRKKLGSGGGPGTDIWEYWYAKAAQIDARVTMPNSNAYIKKGTTAILQGVVDRGITPDLQITRLELTMDGITKAFTNTDVNNLQFNWDTSGSTSYGEHTIGFTASGKINGVSVSGEDSIKVTVYPELSAASIHFGDNALVKAYRWHGGNISLTGVGLTPEHTEWPEVLFSLTYGWAGALSGSIKSITQTFNVSPGSYNGSLSISTNSQGPVTNSSSFVIGAVTDLVTVSSDTTNNMRWVKKGRATYQGGGVVEKYYYREYPFGYEEAPLIYSDYAMCRMEYGEEYSDGRVTVSYWSNDKLQVWTANHVNAQVGFTSLGGGDFDPNSTVVESPPFWNIYEQ